MSERFEALGGSGSLRSCPYPKQYNDEGSVDASSPTDPRGAYFLSGTVVEYESFQPRSTPAMIEHGFTSARLHQGNARETEPFFSRGTTAVFSSPNNVFWLNYDGMRKRKPPTPWFSCRGREETLVCLLCVPRKRGRDRPATAWIQKLHWCCSEQKSSKTRAAIGQRASRQR